MPVYYDSKARSWFCKFYYKDASGSRRQKKKRGFKKQKEAKAWERTFLETQQYHFEMTFSAFTDIYMHDMEQRLRQSTMNTKYYIIRDKLLPHFAALPLSSITPADIRNWQSQMLSYRGPDGMPYKETYLKAIQNQLSAIFNYAVRYYNLRENPCRRAGSIGKSSAGAMRFWTKEEFETFIAAVDKIQLKVCFQLLYYTGIRVGELLALTPEDFDFAESSLKITKSLQRLGGEDLITPPKTPKSLRTITLPVFLSGILKNYLAASYIRPEERIFLFTKSLLGKRMKTYMKLAGVPQIRLHDLRHSHASLLVELGFSPLLIAERLGHEKIETTLNTYSHLYPNKQQEIAQKLQEMYR